MARLPIKVEVVRRLFALSGNECADPNCDHELITPNGTYVAEICHIEAANPGGARFNPDQSDEARRGFENLLLLCHKHHVVSDNYNIETLRQIKANHEQKFIGKETYLPQQVEEKIVFEINAKLDELLQKVDENVGVSREILDAVKILTKQTTHEAAAVNDMAIYAQQLEFIKDLKKEGSYRTALSLLIRYKADNWEKLSPELKFKTIANIAILHLNLHDKTEAINWMLLLESIEHEHPDKYAYLALGYGIKNDAQNFSVAFDKAIALGAENSNLWLGYIYIHEHSIDPDELVKAIPEAQLQKSEIVFTLADLYYRLLREAEGRVFLEKAGELAKDSLIFSADIKAFMATKSLPKLVTMFKVFQKQYSAEEMKEIETAHQYFTESWEVFKGTEMASVRSHILINRGVLNKLLQRTSESNADFREAYYLKREYLPLKNLILEYLTQKNTVEATKLIDEHLHLGSPLTVEQEAEIINMQSRVLLLEGKVQEGLAKLETLLAERYAFCRRRTLLILGHICIEHKRYYNAKAYCLTLFNEFPNDIETMLINADIKIAESKMDDAVAILDSASTLITNGTEPQITFELASVYIILKEFEKALKLLNLIVSLDIFNDVTQSVIFCHINMGSYALALSLAEPLFEKKPDEHFLAKMIMQCRDVTGQFEEAIKTGEKYIGQPGSTKKDLFRYRTAILFARLKQSEKLIAALLSISDYTVFNMDQVFQIAYFLGTGGEVQKGLELAYQSRSKYYDNSKAHLSYLQVLGAIPRPTEELFPEVVSSIDGVDLEDDKKNIEHYLISNENTRGENIIRSDSALAKALIGTKKQQLINFDKGFGLQKKYTIKNILNKYTYAFQETMRLFATRFAGEQGVTVMNTDPQNPFAELEELLRSQASEKNHLDKESSENHAKRILPLGTMALMERIGFVKHWCNLLYRPDFYQQVFLGTNAQNLANSLSEKKAVVLDITVLLLSAFMLKSYRLLEILGLPLYITQSTIDEIQQFYEELDQFSKTGRKAIGYENGGVVLHQLTQDEIMTHQLRLNGLLEWCQQNTKITAPAKADTDWKQRDERTQVLGKATYDTILLAGEIGGTVYSDDGVIVTEVLSINNVTGFSSFDVASHFHFNKQLSDAEFDTCYGHMILANYISLPGTAKQIWNAFNSCGFQIIKPFTTAVKSFSILLPDFAANRTAEFLKMLWVNLTSESIRTQTTLFIFNEIAGRKDSHTVFPLLRLAFRQEFFLLPIQLKAVLELLNAFDQE